MSQEKRPMPTGPLESEERAIDPDDLKEIDAQRMRQEQARHRAQLERALKRRRDVSEMLGHLAAAYLAACKPAAADGSLTEGKIASSRALTAVYEHRRALARNAIALVEAMEAELDAKGNREAGDE